MNHHVNEIRPRIAVTRQMIIQSKAYILEDWENDCQLRKILGKLLGRVGINTETHIPLNKDAPEQAYSQAANIISWRFATGEALLELIHAGIIAPSTHHVSSIFETLHFDHRNGSDGINAQDLKLSLSVPEHLEICPSHALNPPQLLADPDLFLHHANIPGLPMESEEALREAIRCFRHDLYTACLAMLGKASEGAWIECGLALVNAAPHGTPKMDKERDMLLDPQCGIGKKIENVLKLYERQDLFAPVAKASGMKIQALRNVVVWADQVRDSRNTVHYGAKAHMPNTYETVAALLMGAVPHFKVLCTIKVAAETIASGQLTQVTPEMRRQGKP